MNLDAEWTLGNLTTTKFHVHVLGAGLLRLVLAGVYAVAVIGHFQLKRSLIRVLTKQKDLNEPIRTTVEYDVDWCKYNTYVNEKQRRLWDGV